MKSHIVAVASAGASMLLAVSWPVHAQQPAAPRQGPQIAQAELRDLQRQLQTLQERIQELERQQTTQAEAMKAAQEEAPNVNVGTDRDQVRLELGGRINQAYIFADNGETSQSFIADNDNSGSRIGFRAEGDFGKTWTSGVYLEAGFEVNTSDEIDFGDQGPIGDEAGESDFLDVRHAEWYVQHERWGELWLGWGNTATEEVSEVDLSGTGSTLSESDVDDIGGGLTFTTGQTVNDLFENLDGDRTSRVAYFSPDLFGFSVGVSGRQDSGRILPEAGIYFAGEFMEFAVEAAAGWRPDENVVDGIGSNVFHGSLSVLSPMGISLTLAGGTERFEDEEIPAGLDLENQNFWFAKLGYRADLFQFGQTRFAIDYFNGDDITYAGAVLDERASTESYALGVTQAVEPLSSEFYFGMRLFEVEFPAATGFADPDNLFVLFTGALVRF